MIRPVRHDLPAGCDTGGRPCAQPQSATAASATPRAVPALASAIVQRLVGNEELNFLLTNRIPRILLTRFMGRFSRIEQPLVRDLSLAVWRAFAPELDLSDARKQRFSSLHDCFVRELKPGARPVDADPGVLVSPCDAVVGACGRVEGTRAWQAKGFPYAIADLLCDDELVQRFRDGHYITLRLRSTMYHRFHAPCDGALSKVRYIAGDTWNVNPPALKRIQSLYCKNERAVMDLELPDPARAIALVPVAAILVASIRLHCLDAELDLRYGGPTEIPCSARFRKGDELGWFQHGSTIIVFADRGFRLAPDVQPDVELRMGQPLLVDTGYPASAPDERALPPHA